MRQSANPEGRTNDRKKSHPGEQISERELERRAEQSREALLTTAEAAEYLNIAEATLNNYRSTGRGPPFVCLGRARRYRRGDLDAHIAERVFRSTSEVSASAGGAR